MGVKREIFDYRNSPTAWFCTLENAIKMGNCKKALEAISELKRLGFTVLFQPTNQHKGELKCVAK